MISYFAPQAQAQTHAQVWVRFINLPHEYWEKQTLFEIASGLGTPLTIDETTQNRQFGLFARVLIHVDLSEELFESVVVERDDRALSILVQYEKHSLYCAHCRMLGHSVQTFSKLNTSSKSNGYVPLYQKPHNVTTNTLNKAGLSGRIDMNTSGSSILIGNKNATFGSAKTQRSGKSPIQLQSEPVTEFEEGEILPSQKFNQVESHAADKPSSTKLTLQNSFELLEEDEALVPGEARPIAGDFPSLTVEEVPGIIDRQCALITAPIFDDNITLQHVITPITTSDEIFGPDKRKVKFTVGPKNMSIACLKDGKALGKFLGVEPDTDIITTQCKLVLAKGKVQISGESKNVSAASMKSVQILSKSWGDEEDTDPATDSTMERDTESENLLATLKFSPKADKYLDTPLEINKFTKPGRKSRKHKSPNEKGSGGITSSEHIQTRSKKGVIKSNPKYV